MAESLKVLGQVSPTASSPTTLYTVPAATSTVVSSITICNQNATGTTFSISVAIAGAAQTNAQYIVNSMPIIANGTVFMTLGLTLATTDLIRVVTPSSNVSFNAFGTEVS